jgi:hypothetical protein
MIRLALTHWLGGVSKRGLLGKYLPSFSIVYEVESPAFNVLMDRSFFISAQ